MLKSCVHGGGVSHLWCWCVLCAECLSPLCSLCEGCWYDVSRVPLPSVRCADIMCAGAEIMCARRWSSPHMMLISCVHDVRWCTVCSVLMSCVQCADVLFAKWWCSICTVLISCVQWCWFLVCNGADFLRTVVLISCAQWCWFLVCSGADFLRAVVLISCVQWCWFLMWSGADFLRAVVLISCVQWCWFLVCSVLMFCVAKCWCSICTVLISYVNGADILCAGRMSTVRGIIWLWSDRDGHGPWTRLPLSSFLPSLDPLPLDKDGSGQQVHC